MIARKIFLLLFLFTGHISSEVNMTTIDSFLISSMGSHSLMISKKAPSSNNALVFFMNRPYCICERVGFVMGNPSAESFQRPKEDSYVKGKIKIDNRRAQEVKFLVFLARPEKEMNVIEPRNFPSIRNANIIEIESPYGKSKFIMEGFQEAMKQSTKICESFIPYLKEGEIKELDL